MFRPEWVVTGYNMNAPSDSAVETTEAIVYVVDDDPAILRFLKQLISDEGLCVQTFTSGREFLEGFNPHGPACLLLDLQMPDLSGADLQKELLSRQIQIPIIFVTANADVPTTVQIMKQGASDLVEKPFDPDALLTTIRRAIASDFAASLQRRQTQALRERYAQLTSREREVMDRVVCGNANKQIARQLKISAKTVELHRSRVMKKMQAESLAELVHLAILLGLSKPTRGPDDPQQ